MSNTCECPSPPGGSVRCAPDQFAYCVVVRGKAKTGCYKPRRTAIRSAAGSSSLAFMRHISRIVPKAYRRELLGNSSVAIENLQFESGDGLFKMTFTRPGNSSSSFSASE